MPAKTVSSRVKRRPILQVDDFATLNFHLLKYSRDFPVAFHKLCTGATYLNR
jgi:hypothetical protein